MALGWDQALAEACVLEGVPFDAFVPFLGQESVWPEKARAKYKWLMSRADLIAYTAPPGYAAWKMQTRNEAMVKSAGVMLALWDGSAGGTANCVRYAEKVGTPVLNVWERWVAFTEGR